MSTALFEHSWYIGDYISSILYGIELVMYHSTVKALHRRSNRTRSSRFFMIYSTVMVLLLTIDTATNAIWAERMWIDGRNGPGGVSGYIATQMDCWYQAMGSSATVMLVFMSDALMIYRCYIIWGSNPYVILPQIMMYLSALSLAVCELMQAYEPGGNFFARNVINFGMPYCVLEIGMNAIVTALICWRLFYLSKLIRQVLGGESASPYTSMAAIMIESAAPYSIVGIMFLVPYALGSDIAAAFGQVWAKVTVLAPQLIILRVASGTAWDEKVITQATGTTQLTSQVTGPVLSLDMFATASSGPSGCVDLTSSSKNCGRWNSIRSSQHTHEIC